MEDIILKIMRISREIDDYSKNINAKKEEIALTVASILELGSRSKHTNSTTEYINSIVTQLKEEIKYKNINDVEEIDIEKLRKIVNGILYIYGIQDNALE